MMEFKGDKMAKLIAGKKKPILLRGFGTETIVVGFEAVEVKGSVADIKKKSKVIAGLFESGDLKEFKEPTKDKDK